MSTLKDVAALAGVSITTASHTLNKTRFVEPATAARVFEAARALSYSPNRIAQGLRTGSSRTIAVVGVSTTDPYFAEVVRGIEERAYERSYEVFLGFVEYPRNVPGPSAGPIAPEELTFNRAMLSGRYEIDSPAHGMALREKSKESDIVAKLLSREIDGLVLNPSQADESLRTDLSGIRQPVVLFQRDVPGLSVDVYTSADEEGLTQALKRLFALGHVRIAMVYGYSYPSHAARNRFRAWTEAHKAAGLVCDPGLMRQSYYDMEWSGLVTRDLLKKESPPTAIVYWSDYLALAGMAAAQKLGLSVPKDLSVVGFDDLDFASYLNPPLSTVRQDRMEGGRAVADTLIDRIEGRESGESRRISMPTRFVERGSTGPAPGR